MSRIDDLKSILDAALQAVAPDRAVANALALDGSILTCAGREYDLDGFDRIFILGAGKGAAPMAAEVEALLGDRLTDGLIVIKYGHGQPLTRTRVIEAAHPVPDAAGEEGARRLLAIAESAGERDLILCLITGGASALTPAPAEGVTLGDIQHTTSLLMQAGASIHELNAVRKHLSSFSGGQFARAASPATVLTLIVSDVVGDDLDVIASGPTSPDSSTFADARAVLEAYGLDETVPLSVRARIESGCLGRLADTPKEGDPAFAKVVNRIVAGNAMALDAAAARAESLGYTVRSLSDPVVGEARLEAAALARQALELTACRNESPVCILAGGETVVTVCGCGKGGRNQEMALAFAMSVQGSPAVHALFAGTDGTDGPTDAAGGFARPESLRKGAQAGLDPRAYLDDNDAYNYLRETGDLLVTGPTRTNVMDISIIVVD